MPTQKKNRNQTFGRLLSGAINSIATYEGKTTPIVEDELGEQIGVSGKTIQRYKSGILPPVDRDHDIINILAEAAVQRGFLGREWLQRFLHAARYPAAEQLLNDLCPHAPGRPRPERIYANLPAPTYNQFVMRKEAFAELIDGLKQRSAMVVVVGLGGNGKTSLAREVAAHCLYGNGTDSDFDAVVWVSDKDRQGTTNLSVVLDEIARTLDYPGFTHFEHDEKQYEVEQLLRRQRVLLVIDNFETITDAVLLNWLLRLPEPSKAIITTREYHRQLRGSWPIELRGMTDDEAQELINERLRMLKMEKLVNDPSQFDPLIAATGGNPMAITMTLGLLKYERRPLQHVIDDLYGARGQLFDDLFTRAWALLNDAARRILLVTPLFVDDASEDALAATADVQGFAFDHAIERLTDISLLNTQQTNLSSVPRYALHPLVRSFARAKLNEQPDFEASARERWVHWYVQFANQVGFCWDDLSKLRLLDPEQNTMYTAVQWAFQQQMYRETIELVNGVRYYYNVRGLWDERSEANRMRIEAARQLPDEIEEIHALAYHIQLLCKQGNLIEAEQEQPRLCELAQSVRLSEKACLEPRFAQAYFDFHYAAAVHMIMRRDLDHAQSILQDLLSYSERLAGQSYVLNRRWLARCFYHKGDLAEAQRLFIDSLRDAEAIGDQRSFVGNKIWLAAIELDCGHIEAAETILQECSQLVQHYEDRSRLSEIQYLYARLHRQRGDIPAARAALTEAIDLFERMGMRRELSAACNELSQLEMREPVSL